MMRCKECGYIGEDASEECPKCGGNKVGGFDEEPSDD